jgi:hypothetical protein
MLRDLQDFCENFLIVGERGHNEGGKTFRADARKLGRRRMAA